MKGPLEKTRRAAVCTPVRRTARARHAAKTSTSTKRQMSTSLTKVSLSLSHLITQVETDEHEVRRSPVTRRCCKEAKMERTAAKKPLLLLLARGELRRIRIRISTATFLVPTISKSRSTACCLARATTNTVSKACLARVWSGKTTAIRAKTGLRSAWTRRNRQCAAGCTSRASSTMHAFLNVLSYFKPAAPKQNKDKQNNKNTTSKEQM